MEGFKVVESASELDWGFEDLFYNESSFQEISNDLPQKHFYLTQGDKILGHLACSIEAGVAHSHIRAPFGGFNFAGSVKNESQLFFILEVNRRLKENGLSELIIDQAPENLSSSGLEINLETLGYIRTKERIYQMIELSDRPYAEGLHEMELRKLKKAQDLNLEVQWVGDSQFKRLHDFILTQRNEKGFEFSLSWAVLKEFKKAFPDRYLGMAIMHEGQIIAGTILIKENEESIYNFAPAHLVKYNRYSPVVFMTGAIYNWAQEEGFSYLNLGTSYLGDASNESLFSFKEKLGAKPYVASTFQKVLNS